MRTSGDVQGCSAGSSLLLSAEGSVAVGERRASGSDVEQTVWHERAEPEDSTDTEDETPSPPPACEGHMSL